LDKAKLSIKIFDAESNSIYQQEVDWRNGFVEKHSNSQMLIPGTYTVTVKSERQKTITEDLLLIKLNFKLISLKGDGASPFLICLNI